MDTKTNTPTDQQALAAPKDKPVGRRRLPPALRVQQILDNALLEFEEHGFQAYVFTPLVAPLCCR